MTKFQLICLKCGSEDINIDFRFNTAIGEYVIFKCLKCNNEEIE